MMIDQKNFPPVEEVLDAYQSLQEDYAVAMARIKELESAQSPAVPVMGEPVAWLINSPPRHVHLSKSTEVGLNGATQEPLYLAPTTSITAQELDALRKDAERYRWLREQHWSEAEICVVTNPKDAIKLGYYCPSSVRLDSAIDAAIAQGKGG